MTTTTSPSIPPLPFSKPGRIIDSGGILVSGSLRRPSLQELPEQFGVIDKPWFLELAHDFVSTLHWNLLKECSQVVGF
ncbi:hypothetical protein MLD38_016155 [Melastoma candidum]|uniref:Uncharacterized protein n=1 Tax=Melastoma candidum TaxID=119954 RepID=A0ACB9RIJ6_9MYRT|nr:hypothetical protein MLD38_016155 [Melastoma candidum]